MLSVELKGGLGNQLFQLGFLDYISKITGRSIYLNNLQSPHTEHSQNQYYETIFQEWKKFHGPRQSIMVFEPYSQTFQDWKGFILSNPNNIIANGYFQRYEYMDLIREEFISKLKFNTSILEKYPEISNKIFIHIRGGDYKNNPVHDTKLSNYYTRCLDLCKDDEFIIFTNDIPYAKTILPNTQIIQEDELNTLYLMSKAKGCICANSTFSWWGAYLNPNRPIFMPSKWFNDQNLKANYYFKGVQVIEV